MPTAPEILIQDEEGNTQNPTNTNNLLPLVVGTVRSNSTRQHSPSSSSMKSVLLADIAKNDSKKTQSGAQTLPHSTDSSAVDLFDRAGITLDILEESSVTLDGISVIGLMMPSFLSPKVPDEKMTEEKKYIRRRIVRLENSVIKMASSTSGLKFKQKKKKTETCVYGTDIFEWFLQTESLGFMDKEEVSLHLRHLVEYGFLLSLEGYTTFINDSSFYMLQSPLLWPQNINWTPSELEYVSFLLRRKAGKEIGLKLYESDRLDYFRQKLESKWPAIEANVFKQNEVLNKLTKIERKRFTYQEFGLFLTFCPDPEARCIEMDNKQASIIADESSGKCHTEQQFETSLNPTKLLAYLTKKNVDLAQSLALKTRKVSISINSYFNTCELFQPLDSMITKTDKINHWTVPVAEGFPNENRKTLSVFDMRIWVNSFTGLLKDPIGLSYFTEFLEKEHSQENLQFWLKTEGLDTSSNADTRVKFTAQALIIYNSYVADSSPQELNLPAHIKNLMHDYFLPENIKVLPYKCFVEAQEHIFSLMQRDSYQRFCNSDMLNKIYINKVKDKAVLVTGDAHVNVALKLDKKYIEPTPLDNYECYIKDKPPLIRDCSTKSKT